MKKKKEEIKLRGEINCVEQQMEFVDVDGVHLILTDGRAFFYHMFATMDGPERAIEVLYPLLLPDIRKAKEKKNGVILPENAVQSPERGI